MLRGAGIGGWGSTGMAGLVPDEFDVDGNASCILESGLGSVIGAILPACNAASGEVIRTKGFRVTIVKDSCPIPALRQRQDPRILHIVASRQPSCSPRTIRHPQGKSATLQHSKFAKFVPHQNWDVRCTRAARAISNFGSVSQALFRGSVPSKRSRKGLPASNFDAAISALW